MKKTIIVLLIMCSFPYFTACSDSGVQDTPLIDEITAESVSDTAGTESEAESAESLSDKAETKLSVPESETIDIQDINKTAGTESEADAVESLSDKAETELSVPESETIDIQDINNLFYSGAIDVIRGGNGRIRTIIGKFTDKTVSSAEDAAELLNSMSSLFGSDFHAEASDFTVQEYENEVIYRYSPSINGVPVSGSQIVLDVENGEVTFLSSTYDSLIESADTEISVTRGEAEKIAVDDLLASKEWLIDALVTESGLTSEEVTAVLLDALDIGSELEVYTFPQEEPQLMWSVMLKGKYLYQDDGDEEEYCDWDDIYDYGKYMWSDLSDTYYIYANGESAGEIKYIDDGMVT